MYSKMVRLLVAIWCLIRITQLDLRDAARRLLVTLAQGLSVLTVVSYVQDQFRNQVTCVHGGVYRYIASPSGRFD